MTQDENSFSEAHSQVHNLNGIIQCMDDKQHREHIEIGVLHHLSSWIVTTLNIAINQLLNMLGKLVMISVNISSHIQDLML